MIVSNDALALKFFGAILFVLLLFAGWRVAIDTNKVEVDAFQTERRFISGSGFGAILICVAASVEGLNDDQLLAYILIPSAILAVTFLFVALKKQEAAGTVFNFTQCYLMLMATYTGYSASVVGVSKCVASSPAPKCDASGDFAFAWIFFAGWLLALSIFVANLLKIELASQQKLAASQVIELASQQKRTASQTSYDLWDDRHYSEAAVSETNETSLNEQLTPPSHTEQRVDANASDAASRPDANPS